MATVENLILESRQLSEFYQIVARYRQCLPLDEHPVVFEQQTLKDVNDILDIVNGLTDPAQLEYHLAMDGLYYNVIEYLPKECYPILLNLYREFITYMIPSGVEDVTSLKLLSSNGIAAVGLYVP